MIGEASSSNQSSFSGSNALSHVYINYPQLKCHVPGASSFFYDDGNKLILSLTSSQVFSWKTTPYNPYVAPSSDTISEGPVLSIRYSLDLKLLAIQRSIYEIQIWNKETGETYSQKCRPQSETILGFFWTDSSTCDIVFVKTSGLDLFKYDDESRSLHLVEAKKMNISWYIYTHESRLVLLASGMQCRSFTGYQMSSVGTVRLPKFEMMMAKSAANVKPILAAEDVHIITVYGRIYCLQFDRVAMVLHLYRFYRDAVIQQGSLPAYSNRIAVSVVDNVLLVHQVEAKVVIIYDLFADLQVPLSAPLPLLLRGFPRANVTSSQKASSDSKNISDTELTVYGDQWNFLVPDLVCDVSNGFLWKLNIDLEAISTSSSEVHLILEFLQRRKLEAEKAKHLCLGIVRTIILERKPIPVVAKAIDILLSTYSHAIKTGSYYKRITAEETPYGSSSRPSHVVEESINQIDSSENYIKQESEGVPENVSYDRSQLETSDSDSSLKSNSRNPDFLVGKGERANLLEPDTAGWEVPPSGQSHSQRSDNDQLTSNPSEQRQSQVTSSGATSPADLYNYVFAPVEEEMAGDGSYLMAIIVEFLRSANFEKLKAHPDTYVLMVQILDRDERHADIQLFVTSKIIEPSKEVALQLVESGRHNLHIRKLGLGMLRQLSLHHDYVMLLVQNGYYLEALRYARKTKVNTVQPSLFLEAAKSHASKDTQQVAAVLRFFSDFIPGFKQSSNYHEYLGAIAADMNS
ncbi:uncharacterized protein LOC127256669 [Andrographis paniculata]|uniref:uncharacterized protein LOC127256669 n=1 Tax=Andrographis paniculata TaxID=175694 RepID=UPI0021E981E0|nr:uncharacterized protein LOC127256669 [Andrographis paniculata]XP_051138750.1 uncharacterized protein LOC127256669 [Andrographis paniculata]